jgi:hypothetical protein
LLYNKSVKQKNIFFSAGLLIIAFLFATLLSSIKMNVMDSEQEASDKYYLAPIIGSAYDIKGAEFYIQTNGNAAGAAIPILVITDAKTVFIKDGNPASLKDISEGAVVGITGAKSISDLIINATEVEIFSWDPRN